MVSMNLSTASERPPCLERPLTASMPYIIIVLCLFSFFQRKSARRNLIDERWEVVPRQRRRYGILCLLTTYFITLGLSNGHSLTL